MSRRPPSTRRPDVRARAAAAACAATLAAVLALAAPGSARAEIKDRIAAVVNGQPITLSDVIDRVQVELGRVAQSGDSPAEQARLRQEWLKRGVDQLIDDKLIEAEAATIGIDVTDDEVNRQVEALAKQNNLEVAGFRAALQAQGIDFDVVKDSLRRQALQFRLLQYKVKPRKVSDEEVQAAYAAQNADPEHELKVRNLFIPAPEGASPAQLAEARAKAELALKRLAKGDEFAVVARDLSAAPSAHEGGDLGWLRKGSLFAEADAALAALTPGKTSPLLQNGAGFHLFHLDELRPIPPKPLSEVQEEIRARLGNDSILKERENYLRSLRKTAQVDVKL